MHVIYYSRAWDLVASIRFYDHNLFIDAEMSVSGMLDGSETLDQQITIMAYEILRMMVTHEYEPIHFGGGVMNDKVQKLNQWLRVYMYKVWMLNRVRTG